MAETLIRVSAICCWWRDRWGGELWKSMVKFVSVVLVVLSVAGCGASSGNVVDPPAQVPLVDRVVAAMAEVHAEAARSGDLETTVGVVSARGEVVNAANPPVRFAAPLSFVSATSTPQPGAVPGWASRQEVVGGQQIPVVTFSGTPVAVAFDGQRWGVSVLAPVSPSCVWFDDVVEFSYTVSSGGCAPESVVQAAEMQMQLGAASS